MPQDRVPVSRPGACIETGCLYQDFTKQLPWQSTDPGKNWGEQDGIATPDGQKEYFHTFPGRIGPTSCGKISVFEALNICATRRKLFLQTFKPAIQMVDTVDDGFSLRRQTGDNQRNRRPEIGRHDLCTL